ncbi:SDR family oxidoreductase [Mesorhizobium shangrilense]|uniref:SDR family oxidoreductase n=1 Tax=Mesorhizobium shangrilense TaxID=460060 RepID=UPI003F497E22
MLPDIAVDTRAVAKRMIAARKPGSLINISSQMAHVGGIDRAVYGATKHAMEGFTKSMSIEWGHYGIRVLTNLVTDVAYFLTWTAEVAGSIRSRRITCASRSGTCRRPPAGPARQNVSGLGGVRCSTPRC